MTAGHEARADLLALTPDALAALANRGLLKRAIKDVEAEPAVTTAADGTVEVAFQDGVHTVLPPGRSLDAAICGCGAPGVCRHRIGAVLAYQRHQGAPAENPDTATWSPGMFTDDELAAEFGARALAAARRTRSAGYSARIQRASAADRAATVEMSFATVRFLVPGEVGHVYCDARADARAELVVLAVWAFRVADATHPDEPECRVQLAGEGAESTDTGLADTLTVLDELVRDGSSTAGPVLTATLRRQRDRLAVRGLRWPAAGLDDLVEQLTSYQERNANYSAARVAELVAELHARDRAALGSRAQVLGTEESAEVPLRQVRLVALGCRVRAAGADVFLAHPLTRTVLVLRHQWKVQEDTSPPAAARRVVGTTLGALAQGNVLSEAAVRTASRVVRFAAGSLSRTMVAPLGDAWADLPDGLLAHGVADLRTALADRPPRLVRARVVAEFVWVLPVTEVRSVRYRPGPQRLDAVLVDADGDTATVALPYRASAPAAMDALATALADEPRLISGIVRRGQGGIVVEPLTVLTASGPVVLDLATADTATLTPAGAAVPDQLTGAVQEALAVLAEAAHRGLRNLPGPYAERIEAAAAALDLVSMATSADLLRAWASDTTPESWVAAQIRLLTAAELR
jgi:hypothetical protein